MHTRSFALTLGILAIAGSAEARSFPLERAAEAGVRVEATAPNGGYSRVTLTLRNQSEEPVTIAALPGTILDNRASEEQNLTFGGPVSLSVGPGQTVSREVATFCLNQNLHSPSPGAQFDVSPTPDPGLAAYIGSAHPDQGEVWNYLSNRGRPVEPPPRQAEMNCIGPQGGFQICVNTQANQVQPGAQALTPTAITQIPILEMPQPTIVPPPPPAPVIRPPRPPPTPAAPPAPIGQPDPHVNQGITIEQN